MPLILTVYGIVAVWFFQYGNAEREVAKQRKAKPWYRLKTEPSYADMLAALRRTFWTARISMHPTPRPHRAKIIRLLEGLAQAA